MMVDSCELLLILIVKFHMLVSTPTVLERHMCYVFMSCIVFTTGYQWARLTKIIGNIILLFAKRAFVEFGTLGAWLLKRNLGAKS